MSLRDDVDEMKKEFKEVKEQSLAMEMLKDSKQVNIRICRSFVIIILVLIVLLSIETCYLIYVLNDIATEEIVETETYDIKQDAGDNGNNNFINGNRNEVNN